MQLVSKGRVHEHKSWKNNLQKLHVSKFLWLHIVFETTKANQAEIKSALPWKINFTMQQRKTSDVQAVDGSSRAGCMVSGQESVNGNKILQAGHVPCSWDAFGKNYHKAITTSFREVKISWIRHQGGIIQGEWKLQFLLLEEKIKWTLTDVFRMLNRRSCLNYPEKSGL